MINFVQTLSYPDWTDVPKGEWFRSDGKPIDKDDVIVIDDKDRIYPEVAEIWCVAEAGEISNSK